MSGEAVQTATGASSGIQAPTGPANVGSTPVVNQATNQLPSWYNDLALQFANTASGALSNLNQTAATGYTAPQVADFSGLQQQAFANAGTAFDPTQNIQNAQGALSQYATQYDPSQTQQFLNPYTQNVNDVLAQQAGRNLRENLIPQLNETFVGSGQFGGSRNYDFMDRALRDTQKTLLDQQSTNLNNQWNNAMTQQYQWNQNPLTAATANLNLGQQGQALDWNTINNLYGMGKNQQDLQQKTLDTAYQNWQTQQNQPITQMGALAQMIPSFAALYKPNTTTTTAGMQTPTTGTENFASFLLELAKLTGTPQQTGA